MPEGGGNIKEGSSNPKTLGWAVDRGYGAIGGGGGWGGFFKGEPCCTTRIIFRCVENGLYESTLITTINQRNRENEIGLMLREKSTPAAVGSGEGVRP